MEARQAAPAAQEGQAAAREAQEELAPEADNRKMGKSMIKSQGRKAFLFPLLAILFISVAIAVTGVIQTDNFFVSSTGSSLNNVTSLLFYCNDSACSSIGSQIFSKNSGSTNQIVFEHIYNPSSTETSQDYYAHYFFAQCYLPREYVENVWGYGVSVSYNYNFNKAASCHSPIDSFSVTNSNFANEPVVINVQANLEADAHSAFTNLLLDYVPSGFENYYSAKTKITLEIKNSAGTIVYTDSKTYEILQDTSQNVNFSWVPTTQGNYTANVKTSVIDCQCQSSFNQSSEKQFTVLPARPQNECYTIINDLEATPEFATEGNLVTVNFNRISNYAANDFSKTPTKTNATYTVTDSSGNTVYSNSTQLAANPNGTNYTNTAFTWTPSFGGDFNIKVTGIADDPLCVGKTNTADTAILGFFAKSSTVFQITFNVTDSSTGSALSGANVKFGVQSGATDSAGKVTFNSNSGVFDWNVSKSGYTAKTGSHNSTANATISVALDPVSSGGGSGGSGGSPSSSSKGGTSNIRSFSFVQPGAKPATAGEVPEEIGKGKEKGLGNFLVWMLILEMVLILAVILAAVRRK
jgi:hypothetical protein